MRKPTTWKQSEKTRYQRSQAKRERRKARKKKLTPEQVETKEWKQAEQILLGETLLSKFLFHIVEVSRQREIAENIEDE